MSDPSQREVDLLILGAGWTSTFLLPLLRSQNITHAATTTSGRDNTIQFKFDPDSDDETPYKSLPRSKTVLITFPLIGKGQSKKITSLYWNTHAAIVTNWIQLGSTGIFKGDGWHDHSSPFDMTNARAIAEEELIVEKGGAVLNLAGLYGGARDPRNWVTRVAKTKEQVKAKGGLHLIHGEDVARAVVAVHKHFTPGDRWILTDRRVYDWWDLIDVWGGSLDAESSSNNNTDSPTYRKWVQECLEDENVHALPRDTDKLGRMLDSRAFWKTVGILPIKTLER